MTGPSAIQNKLDQKAYRCIILSRLKHGCYQFLKKQIAISMYSTCSDERIVVVNQLVYESKELQSSIVC